MKGFTILEREEAALLELAQEVGRDPDRVTVLEVVRAATVSLRASDASRTALHSLLAETKERLRVAETRGIASDRWCRLAEVLDLEPIDHSPEDLLDRAVRALENRVTESEEWGELVGELDLPPGHYAPKAVLQYAIRAVRERSLLLQEASKPKEAVPGLHVEQVKAFWEDCYRDQDNGFVHQDVEAADEATRAFVERFGTGKWVDPGEDES